MATQRANAHPMYEDRIVVDPAILVGKPVVRGTRISVELVLDHLAENPDVHELLAAYPGLSMDDVKACLAYAKALVGDEDIYPSTTSAANA